MTAPRHLMSAALPTAVSPSETHRNLPRALLWSLAAHAIVLTLGVGITAISGVDSASPPARNLAARLHGPAGTQPATTVEPAMREPLPAPITSADSPAPAVRPPPERQPAAINTSPAKPQQTPPSPQVDAPASITPPLSPAAPEVVRAIDPSGLRAYHLALGRSARPFKTYPPGLREAGVRGRVAIRVTVNQDGQTVALRLIGSSGHSELDEAAMTMMQLAASHTRVPDSLLGQTFSIDLAVDFSPEDQP